MKIHARVPRDFLFFCEPLWPRERNSLNSRSQRSPVQRFKLIITALGYALFALTAFLQLSRSAAARAPEPHKVFIETAFESINADLQGAGYWIVTANISDANLNIVNAADDTVYGPFLMGQLGPEYGGLLDIVVMPDQTTALVGNFGGQVVHFVDLTNPLSPSRIASVKIPFLAEDIELSEDGRYALVTDGAYAHRVAVIDTEALTTVQTLDLGTQYAQAVDIAPDGTVLIADYYRQQIHTLLLDSSGYITVSNTYTNWIQNGPDPVSRERGWPLNIGIAPDGQTVLVCNALTDTLSVFQILEPGVLTYTGVVTGLSGGFVPNQSAQPNVQSVAFNEAGDRAYVVLNNLRDIAGQAVPDQLAVLDVNAPGLVRINTAGAANLMRTTFESFFGVDVITIAGDKAYIGYPTSAILPGGNDLVVVNLIDYHVTSLPIGASNGEIPIGVAVLPIHLGLQKLGSDLSAQPGQVITYTLVLSASGPHLSDVSVEDALSPGLQFIGPVMIDPPGAGIPGGRPPVIAYQLNITSHRPVSITFPVRVGLVANDPLVVNISQASSPQLINPASSQWELLMERFAVAIPLMFR